MGTDTIDWKCEFCGDISPDRLNRVREIKYPYLTRYVCDKCKDKIKRVNKK